MAKLANCTLSTNQEVLDAFQVCKEKSTRLSKKQFELWEKVCGITFSHHALLLNQTLLDSHLLKPISGYIHDWMHTPVAFQECLWAIAVGDQCGDHRWNPDTNLDSDFLGLLSLLVGACQLQGSGAIFSTKPIQRTEGVQRNHGLCFFIQMKWLQVIHWHPR